MNAAAATLPPLLLALALAVLLPPGTARLRGSSSWRWWWGRVRMIRAGSACSATARVEVEGGMGGLPPYFACSAPIGTNPVAVAAAKQRAASSACPTPR